MAATCIHGGAECSGCMGCAGEEMQFTCPNCGAEIDYDNDIIYCNGNDIVGCQCCIAATTLADLADAEGNCEII